MRTTTIITSALLVIATVSVSQRATAQTSTAGLLSRTKTSFKAEKPTQSQQMLKKLTNPKKQFIRYAKGPN